MSADRAATRDPAPAPEPPWYGTSGPLHAAVTTFLDLLPVYADRRMAKILLIGFISGLPWLLISSMLTLWLREAGLSLTSIGLFTLMFSVYAVNALWAPLVDGVRLPWLTRRFGRRTAWIVLMQAVIAVGVLCVAALPGATGEIAVPFTELRVDCLWLLAAALFTVAVASATQDVAVDAMRIEMVGFDESRKVGAGSAMATCGWWLGMAGTKALALPLVGYLQSRPALADHAWQLGYLAALPIIAACVALLIYFVREREEAARRAAAEDVGDGAGEAAGSTAPRPRDAATARAGALEGVVGLAREVRRLYLGPLAAFVARYGLRIGAMLLAIVFLFKIGEAFLGRMALIFYSEVGFSKSEIGLVSGGLGTIMVCLFAVLGSVVTARFGLYKGILLGGISMAATNLLFAALAWHPEPWLFAFAVVADQFTTAVSTVAFVAFLSQLCDRDYTATQYAALASVGNLSRTTLAASSGLLVDALGGRWPVFFVLTTAMVLPSLVMLLTLRRPLGPLFTGATTRVL